MKKTQVKDVKGAISGLRQLKGNWTFGNWKPFKNDEKCFLFHFKKLFSFSSI